VRPAPLPRSVSFDRQGGERSLLSASVSFQWTHRDCGIALVDEPDLVAVRGVERPGKVLHAATHRCWSGLAVADCQGVNVKA
jgi:hypothetical protein